MLTVGRLSRVIAIQAVVVSAGVVLHVLPPAPAQDIPVQTGADSAAADRIVLRFAGDCLFAGYYEESVHDSVTWAFEGFAGFKCADVAMVNLENPITMRGVKVPKPYNFRMDPHFVRALTEAGIDIVSIANNHIFDYGRQGLFDTISYLDSAGVLHVGAGRDRTEAYRPVILNVRGKRVAFLAYYGGGESPGAGERSPGVARRDLPRVIDGIAAVRENAGADYIVVNFHWGTEKADRPDRGQVEFAHAVIEAGADAVIGHHPHVLQGIERYKNGIIVYSLGNFIFGGNSQSTYNTGIFEVSLGPDEPRYSFLPVGVREWRATMLSGADSAAVTDRMRHLSRFFPRSIFNQ